MNHTLVVIAMIASLVAIAGSFLWRAIYSAKHKNDEKALSILTKAQAWSSWTLMYVFIIWETVSTFILGKGFELSIGRVRIVIMIIWGLQSLSELMAGYYLTHMDSECFKGIKNPAGKSI